jgi:hypothetical protein
MRISANGNVGINTGSADNGSRLQVNGNLSVQNSRLGAGFRTIDRAEFFLNSTGTNNVSEMFFGYGNGYTENNIRWGISDRGTTQGELIFFVGPANNSGLFSSVLTLKSSRVSTFSSSVEATQFTSQGGRGSGFGFKLPDWQIYNTSSGNALAFSNYTADLLTISSLGNVGIGNPNPNALLDVMGAGQQRIRITSIADGSNANPQGSSIFFRSGSGLVETARIASLNRFANVNGSSLSFFVTDNSNVLQERIHINSLGSVGIGTNSPGQKLTLINGTFQIGGTSTFSDNVEIGRVGGDNNMAFATNGTERMRITSGGNVLIGTTSDTYASNFISQTSTANVPIGRFNATNGGYYTQLLQISCANTSTNNTYNAIQFTANGTERFVVRDSGNVQNINNSYGGISDIKLKENIVDTTPKLNDLLKVKVRNYNFIGQESKQLGVIAQELEDIFPSLVDDTKDKDDQGNDLGTTTKSVKYSVFVPMLIKAIQEQQELIQELTARLEILENK